MIFNILDNITKLWMTKYIIGECFSSGGATLYKSPSDQTVTNAFVPTKMFFCKIKGYGHSTPKTDGGKIFTIIYALIGIPVGLIMFNSIGERFNYFTSLLINKIRKMVKAKQQEATELDLIFVGSTLSCIVVTLGTAAFSHYEGNTICSTTISDANGHALCTNFIIILTL